MAYGVISDVPFGGLAGVSVTGTNSFPGGSTSYSMFSSTAFKASYIIRSGSNSIGVRVPSGSLPPRVFVVKKKILLGLFPVPSRPKKFSPYKGKLPKADKKPGYVPMRKVYAELTRYRTGRSRQRFTFSYKEPNPLAYDKIVVSVGGATSATQTAPGGYSRTYTGDLWTPFGLIPGDVSGPNLQSYQNLETSRWLDAVELAQNRTLVKFSDFVAEVTLGLGQIVAEREQTANLLNDAVKRLNDFVRHVSKGNLGLAADSILPTNSKKLANDALAYNFGVKPLISDISDMISTLCQVIDFRETFKRRSKVKVDVKVISDTTSYGIRSVVTEWGEVEVKIACGARCRSPWALKALQLGFGPASLIWELSRWSFIIDWLLPIGDALQQLDTLMVVEPYRVVRTTVHRRFVSIQKTFVGTDAGYTWDGSSVTVTQSHLRVQRVILDNLPAISMTAINQNTQPFSRIVNTLALLRQSIKR